MTRVLQRAAPADSLGTATEFVRSELNRHRGRALVLGSFPTACYLQLSSGTVLGVLTVDAVALPIGVVLAPSSARPDLSVYRGAWVFGGADAGAGRAPTVVLLGLADADELRVEVGGSRRAAVGRAGVPNLALTEHARAGIARRWASTELDPRWLTELPAADPDTAVAALLGRGPGLTPSGDDLLCGVLAGATLFGLVSPRWRVAVLDRLAERPVATTALSRQLLLRAAAGEAPPEVGQLGRALCGSDPGALEAALTRVLAYGHSSGTALAAGVLGAATAGPRRGRP